MSERPSTSDGPGTHNPGGDQFRFDDRNFSKRVSRDDSFLRTKPHAGADLSSYGNARVRQVAPGLGPQSIQASGTAAIPTIRMPVPIRVPVLEDLGEIGMALGSPRQQSANWHSSYAKAGHKPSQAVAPPTYSPSPGGDGANPAVTAVPKKQPGKWKLFGMFGRKHSEPSSNAISVPEIKEARGPQPAEHGTATPPSQSGTKLERSQTLTSRKTPRHKPITIRSNTMQYGGDTTKERQPRLGDNLEQNKSLGSLPIARGGSPSPPMGPLLNVEIPTVELERYSVMFSSVLNNPPSSNLLTRRQATLQQLKRIDNYVINEQETRHERSRRATSPRPTDFPEINLSPPPPIGQEASKPHRLSPRANTPLTRSNTSPSAFRSPSNPASDPPPIHEQTPPSRQQSSYNHLRDPVKEDARGRLTIATLAKGREQHSAQRPFRFDPEVSSHILESPADSEEDDGNLKSPEVIRLDPSLSRTQQGPEPTWQMMTSSPLPLPQQAPSAASSGASSRKRSPSSASSSQTANSTLPSSQSSMHDEVAPFGAHDSIPITSDMNPVEASIARQISLSRQQRKLLKPLQAGHSASRQRDNAPKISSDDPSSKHGPEARVGATAKVAMAETKSSVPTLVVPRDQLPQNRKSETIVLESA
ncbi:hypothetical protein DL768_010358 [Monosporascus sp. mg162]|nr:hypothetical protein DL768_010358 [Monosporascus sp. mg162]